VPDSELQRLQGKYPYDDMQATITQAGKHTKGYPENARQTIKADPRRILEFDLELWWTQQFVKKFVSEQWLLSCLSLVVHLLMTCKSHFWSKNGS